MNQLRGVTEELAAGHYIFSGNPGTGKTTVARRMGQIFKALGLLKKGHVVSVGRSDLVAGYSGQTALKTKDVLKSAMDGILFIDEAYQLDLDDRDAFGKEAREELVAYMENNRGRFCLIAAGYPKPMDKFLNGNPGLKSRFTGTLTFEDFSVDELMQIFHMSARSRERTLGEGVEEYVRRWLEAKVRHADATFGNAREVRKLLDAMSGNLDSRLAREITGTTDPKDERLYRFERSDVPPEDTFR